MVDRAVHLLPMDGNMACFLFRFQSDKLHCFGMLLVWSYAAIVLGQCCSDYSALLSQFVDYDIQIVLF
jgi:hypothetical protein